jgi:uncharacterized repeat protein (TIGR01451 family)
MRYYYNVADNLADMQILLYEGSHRILVQFQNLTESPTSSYTGLEGSAPDYPHVHYQDRCPSTVKSNLAILYEPILTPHYQRAAELTFSARTDESLANNTWLTNTASLSSSLSSVQRTAGTLINPIDLTTSTKTTDKLFAEPGQQVTYELLLNNTGQVPAEGVTLVDPIPAYTAYEPNSLSCTSGVCSYAEQENEIHWLGDIADGGQVALRFAVRVASVEHDDMPIVNVATLREAAGQEHELRAVLAARTSDLSRSSKEADSERVDYEEVLTYTIRVQNAGQVDTTAIMRDHLPAELTYVPDSLSCTSGSCAYTDGTIAWQGALAGQTSVPIQFQVRAPDPTYPEAWLVNTAVLTDTDRDRVYTLRSQVRLGDAPDWTLYLPLVPQAP